MCESCYPHTIPFANHTSFPNNSLVHRNTNSNSSKLCWCCLWFYTICLGWAPRLIVSVGIRDSPFPFPLLLLLPLLPAIISNTSLLCLPEQGQIMHDSITAVGKCVVHIAQIKNTCLDMNLKTDFFCWFYSPFFGSQMSFMMIKLWHLDPCEFPHSSKRKYLAGLFLRWIFSIKIVNIFLLVKTLTF